MQARVGPSQAATGVAQGEVHAAQAELVRDPLADGAAKIVESEIRYAGTPPNNINWPSVLASVTRLAWSTKSPNNQA